MAPLGERTDSFPLPAKQVKVKKDQAALRTLSGESSRTVIKPKSRGLGNYMAMKNVRETGDRLCYQTK